MSLATQALAPLAGVVRDELALAVSVGDRAELEPEHRLALAQAELAEARMPPHRTGQLVAVGAAGLLAGLVAGLWLSRRRGSS